MRTYRHARAINLFYTSRIENTKCSIRKYGRVFASRNSGINRYLVGLIEKRNRFLEVSDIAIIAANLIFAENEG